MQTISSTQGQKSPRIVTVGRSYVFDASHRLPHVPDGHKCKRMHGHTYNVEVQVTGPVQEAGLERGMVLDFAVLDAAWASLHALVDHRTLNEVEGLENPTVELVAPFVKEHLERTLRATHPDLVSVRVYFREGAQSVCIYPPIPEPLEFVITSVEPRAEFVYGSDARGAAGITVPFDMPNRVSDDGAPGTEIPRAR